MADHDSDYVEEEEKIEDINETQTLAKKSKIHAHFRARLTVYQEAPPVLALHYLKLHAAKLMLRKIKLAGLAP